MVHNVRSACQTAVQDRLGGEPCVLCTLLNACSPGICANRKKTLCPLCSIYRFMAATPGVFQLFKDSCVSDFLILLCLHAVTLLLLRRLLLVLLRGTGGSCSWGQTAVGCTHRHVRVPALSSAGGPLLQHGGRGPQRVAAAPGAELPLPSKRPARGPRAAGRWAAAVDGALELQLAVALEPELRWLEQQHAGQKRTLIRLNHAFFPFRFF